MAEKIGKHIAIYGKGGIGKSTITSNISAALAEAGYRVIQIGCDPKSDSTNTLRGNNYLPTVLDSLREGNKIHLDDISVKGFGGVLCIESGGPVPGVGCAGRGINAAVNLLQELNLFEEFKPDYVLYDVLGDVVCGGFSVPLREDYADEVFIVSSGEYMSLYAANNISRGIKKLKGNLGGIICNCKGIEREEEIVAAFASERGTQVIGVIGRSNLIQRSELDAKTVVEFAPESEESDAYRKLANDIFENDNYSTPQPMEDEDFENFFKSFID